jgi:hypothetical protein
MLDHQAVSVELDRPPHKFVLLDGWVSGIYVFLWRRLKTRLPRCVRIVPAALERRALGRRGHRWARAVA